MEEEDNEFFILVLGVLAAIIVVVSWWYVSGGNALDSQPIEAANPEAATEDHGDASTEPEADQTAESVDQAEESAAEPTDTDDSAGAIEETDEEATAADDDEPSTPLPPTTFDAIAANADLSVVSGLLRDEGLDQVLSQGGPFTVLAPSNDAVNTAAGSDTTLAVLENARGAVLSYHVLPGDYSLDELVEIARGGRSTELTTVQGESVSLTIDGDDLIINGNARISGDSQASDNGIVHTLDNVLVPPIAALNSLVELEPILFASGSAEIEEASFVTLDRFIEVLAGSNVSVTIEGHTDSSGDPILNQDLSQGRARSVLNYLVANGIEDSRLKAEGFGSSEPVADNDSEEGRALNRRIEFTLS